MARGNRPQNGLLLAGLIGLAVLATVAAQVANSENEVHFIFVIVYIPKLIYSLSNR